MFDCGGQLKPAAQELSDLIERYPELRYQVAASMVVMMLEPGLAAHREAWEDYQDGYVRGHQGAVAEIA